MADQDNSSTAPVSGGASSSSSSRCPVKHEKASVWTRWSAAAAAKSQPAGPPANKDVNAPANTTKRGGTTGSSASYSSLEEAARYSQAPQSDQMFPLNTSRQVSSIPRGSVRGEGDDSPESLKKKQPKQKSAPYSEEETRTTTTETSATVVVTNLPHHQAGTMGDDHNRWVYPSEQQLYNAMRKKGWTNVPETSIPVVLQIHNAVNEATWSRLLEYHRFGPHESRLVRFQGRPNDVTPKAWFLTRVLGYPKPFDRHDWYVEYYNKGSSSPLFPGGVRGGRWIEQRYVIDFYENDDGSPQSSTSSSSPTRVDVRPALDSPRALWLHAKRALQMSFPGITNYWYKQRRGTAGGQGAKGHPSWDGSQGSIEQEPR